SLGCSALRSRFRFEACCQSLLSLFQFGTMRGLIALPLCGRLGVLALEPLTMDLTLLAHVLCLWAEGHDRQRLLRAPTLLSSDQALRCLDLDPGHVPLRVEVALIAL